VLCLVLPGCVVRDGDISPHVIEFLPDSDDDGLPDAMEAELGINAALTDTDGDGLSDYWEVRKYQTNPRLADSDGDGTPDGQWDERAEYARTIRAVVDLRPPFDVPDMNDFHQDARVVEQMADDVTRVEVVLYPDAAPVMNVAAYRPVHCEHTAPTHLKNYSPEMRRNVRQRLRGCATDAQAVAHVLQLLREARHVRLERDLGCESNLPIHFYIHRGETGELMENAIPVGSCTTTDAVKAAVVYADSMWRLGTRGACGSTATLRGALLRAAGIPERTIMTIPLLYSYETDGTIVEVQSDYDLSMLNIPADSNYISDHFFNEVMIGNQWVRVDNQVGMNGIIIYGKVPGIKIYDCHDPTENNLYEYWNYTTWQSKRPYKYVSVVERPAKK
jgi:hypothetical protein